MKENKKSFGSDFTKVDSHVIQPHEYDEIPEWTDEMFDAADLYVGGKLVKRGRPKKAATAKSGSLRLAPEVEKFFRATGKGWQTRINEVLKAWVAKHS